MAPSSNSMSPTFKININSDALVTYANALEKLHRSALPVAIRQTLNDTAFGMKKNTLPGSAKKSFKERQPNFFKANSKAIPAQGFDINTMASTVAMVSSGLHSPSTNYAVRDLEQQESGGTIKAKTFIAQKGARRGKGNVKPGFRLDDMKQNKFITATRKSKSKFGKTIRVSLKQAFIRAAIMAKATGINFVLGNRNTNGFRTLSIINSVSTKRKSGKLDIHRTALYSVKGGRAVEVSRHNFMKRAAMEAHLTMEASFIKNAQKQFKKAGVAG